MPEQNHIPADVEATLEKAIEALRKQVATEILTYLEDALFSSWRATSQREQDKYWRGVTEAAGAVTNTIVREFRAQPPENKGT